jgi:hypothetical protein
MRNRKFIVVNTADKSYLIRANCVEVALIKAGRLNEADWYVEDELSDSMYCYTVMKRVLAQNKKLGFYEEIVDRLYKYFKARISDKYYDSYIQIESIEDLIGIKEHNDLVDYVINNY